MKNFFNLETEVAPLHILGNLAGEFARLSSTLNLHHIFLHGPKITLHKNLVQ